MSSLFISRQFFYYTYSVYTQYNLQLTISWQLNTKEMNNAYLPNHAIWYNFKDTHIIIIYASIILRPKQQTNKLEEKLFQIIATLFISYKNKRHYKNYLTVACTFGPKLAYNTCNLNWKCLYIGQSWHLVYREIFLIYDKKEGFNNV